MAETANKTPLFIGRAVLGVGDPTQALGAGMTMFEDDFPVVELVHTEVVARGSDRAGSQLASAAYTKAAGLRINVTGYKNQVAALAAMIGSIQANGEGYDVADETVKYDPPTLAVIPVAELGADFDGEDFAPALASGGVFWVPAVQAEGDLSLTFDDTTSGDDANATFSFTLVALKRLADQDGDPIPKGARVYFRGDPANRDLTWSLPTQA